MRICANCGSEIKGNDIHLKLPEGSRKKCAVLMDLKEKS